MHSGDKGKEVGAGDFEMIEIVVFMPVGLLRRLFGGLLDVENAFGEGVLFEN